jgi:hypothetical protein
MTLKKNILYALFLPMLAYLALTLFNQKIKEDIVYPDLPPISGTADQIELFRIAYSISNNKGFALDRSQELNATIRRSISNSRELDAKEKKIFTQRKMLSNDTQEKGDLTAYRDILYPYFASLFINDTPFKSLRYANLVLVIINLALILTVFRFLRLPLYSYVIAGLIYLYHPLTMTIATQILSGTLATTILLIHGICVLHCRKNRNLSSFILLGLTLGLLILVKKQFLILVPLAYLIVLVDVYKGKTSISNFLAVATTSFLVICVLFYNSYKVTDSYDFLTGTNGWNDMPASYSEDLVNSGMYNFYKIRSEIFSEYRKTDKLENEVDYARAGKKIFSDMTQAPGFFERIPALIKLKFLNEVFPKNDPLQLIFFLTAVLGYLLSIRREPITAYFLVTIGSCLTAVMITHGGYGRMLFSTIGLQVIGVGLLITLIARFTIKSVSKQ